MRVDIIIPNYNGSQLIDKGLPSVLAALKEYQGKVIIVDDGSRHKDRENLRKLVLGIKNVELHEHNKNKGFSSAVNSGVKRSTADYVVLLNSDVVPTQDFLKDPIRRLESDENLFAVGCMDKSIEGNSTVLRGRGVAHWERGMVHHTKGEVDAEDTFWVSGGSGVFRRKMYDELGGMDEIYNPFYWEDIDLSYRARKRGYAILFDKNSVVTHFHEEGAIKTQFTATKVTVTSYRNQFIFIWKNITSKRLLVEHLLFLPLHLSSSLVAFDFNLSKGLFLAMGRLPAIIKKRKFQRKFIKISDEEIL